MLKCSRSCEGFHTFENQNLAIFQKYRQIQKNLRKEALVFSSLNIFGIEVALNIITTKFITDLAISFVKKVVIDLKLSAIKQNTLKK